MTLMKRNQLQHLMWNFHGKIYGKRSHKTCQAKKESVPPVESLIAGTYAVCYLSDSLVFSAQNATIWTLKNIFWTTKTHTFDKCVYGEDVKWKEEQLIDPNGGAPPRRPRHEHRVIIVAIPTHDFRRNSIKTGNHINCNESKHIYRQLQLTRAFSKNNMLLLNLSCRFVKTK